MGGEALTYPGDMPSVFGEGWTWSLMSSVWRGDWACPAARVAARTSPPLAASLNRKRPERTEGASRPRNGDPDRCPYRNGMTANHIRRRELADEPLRQSRQPALLIDAGKDRLELVAAEAARLALAADDRG